MSQSISDNFLIACKQNKINNITPSNQKNFSTPGYEEVVNISKEYFNKGKYEEFAEFFQEGHYLIPLWAAHMLLEYGNPPHNIINDSIEVIERYSDNPLAPEVAIEEKKWLQKNIEKYKNFY